MRHLLLFLAVPAFAAFAADLPPDKGSTIPESGKRPVVVTGKSSLALPKHDLPDGYQLEIVAAAPLVTHPIMGCLDDKGRLFVGDAVGVNWNKAQLEANPPNRVLMLEDTDKDGIEKNTVDAADSVIDHPDGFQIVCDPKSLLYLFGMELGYSTQLIGGGFQFQNPNAERCAAAPLRRIFGEHG